MIASTLHLETEAEAAADLEIADLEARILDVEERIVETESKRARLNRIAILSQPDEVKAKVYGQPRNPYLRFLELPGGAKAILRVRKDHPCRAGWEVDVIPEGTPELYLLAGRYNRWGVRCA